MAANRRSGSAKISAGALAADATLIAPKTTNGQTTLTTEDKKLLSFVRGSAPNIVRACATQASASGDAQNWHEMNSYLEIASTLSTLTGVATIEAPNKARALVST